MFITSPENFASWFNQTFPGAYRRITAGDVRGMTACGLICHYRTYSLSRDGETVRGILQYEQMREKQSTQPIPKEEREPPKCKMCGQLLPIEQTKESGRPKEYCPNSVRVCVQEPGGMLFTSCSFGVQIFVRVKYIWHL